jgi:hypothetical protein
METWWSSSKVLSSKLASFSAEFSACLSLSSLLKKEYFKMCENMTVA